MQKLTAGTFRFGDIWGIRHRPFEAQIQFMLDVRGADGFIASALQPLLDDMIPIAPPLPGQIGDIMAASGELRGTGDTLALVGAGKAYLGTRSELLAAVRATATMTAERFAAAGNAEDVRFRAGQMLQSLRSDRPRLQVVSG